MNSIKGLADLTQVPESAPEPQRWPRYWNRCFRGESGPNDSYLLAADSQAAWEGSFSATVVSRAERPNPPGAGICQTFSAASYKGQRVEFSAHLRTRDAVPGAHLVFRAEAANGRLLAFYNMEPRWVVGTKDWARYSVVIDVPESTAIIMVGMSLVGAGVLWIDDVAVEIVGKDRPLTQLPRPLSHYNAVTDLAGLAPQLRNPGFEETTAIAAVE